MTNKTVGVCGQAKSGKLVYDATVWVQTLRHDTLTMRSRPLIGIAMRIEAATGRFYLGRGYSEAVWAADGAPAYISLIPAHEGVKTLRNRSLPLAIKVIDEMMPVKDRCKAILELPDARLL